MITLKSDIDIFNVNEVAQYLKCIKNIKDEEKEVTPHVIETVVNIMKKSPFPEAPLLAWSCCSTSAGEKRRLILKLHPLATEVLLDSVDEKSNYCKFSKERKTVSLEYTNNKTPDPNKFKLHTAYNNLK